MANCSNCRYFNAWLGYCTINKGDSTPHSTCFRYSPKNHNKSKKVAKYKIVYMQRKKDKYE